MRFIAPVLLLLLLQPIALGAVKDQNIFPFDYQKVQLDNGFTAYLIEAGAPGQIAYVTVVRTGSREEWEPGRSGFAHFFEHMMFRGTKKYPEFDKVLTAIGADTNAFTSNDVTAYHIVASSDSLEQVVDLESDRFMNLDYSEADFRTEAGAVLGEFNQGRANPFLYLFEKVRETAFDQHTYKHLTIGFEADVRAMPEGFEYSRSFFSRYYRPENCVLLLAGDFDFAQATSLIRRYYGPWKPGYTEPEIKPEPRQTAPREAVAEFPGRTLPIVSVNYKGPAWNASDRLAVATSVLGELAFGQNSDLYRKLVIQEQKVQSLSANFGLLRDPYLLSINSMVLQSDRVEEVKAEVAATAKRFQSELSDARKLENTKSNMRYSFLMNLETARGAAFSLINVVVNTGGIEAIEDYYRTLEAVTAEDVRKAAQTYLVDSGRTTVTLLPAKERE
jgi:zinc protease